MLALLLHLGLITGAFSILFFHLPLTASNMSLSTDRILEWVHVVGALSVAVKAFPVLSQRSWSLSPSLHCLAQEVSSLTKCGRKPYFGSETGAELPSVEEEWLLECLGYKNLKIESYRVQVLSTEMADML